MAKLLESYWQPVEQQLTDLFREIYFDPLIELFDEPKILQNSSNALLDALDRGIIKITGDTISGKFSIAISRELSKFAVFDGRSRTFKIKNRSLLPHDVYMASFVANDKMKKLYAEMNRRIKYMSDDAKKKFKGMIFDINKSADQIQSALNEDFKKIGIDYKPNETIKEKLVQQYNQNMSLSIVNEHEPDKDWNTEQVERLRAMVEKSEYEGLNKKQLIESIQNEFETSKAKAKFLARQETSLFASTLRDERYIDAGLDLYQWSSTMDIRTVGGGLYKPTKDHGDHYHFNGKICKFSDNTIYADSVSDALKNKWKSRATIGMDNSSPGRPFGCRCIAKAVIT